MRVHLHNLTFTCHDVRRPLARWRAHDRKGSAEVDGGPACPGEVPAHPQKVAVPFLKGEVLRLVVMLPIGVVTLPIGAVMLPIGVVTLPIGVVTLPIGVVMLPIGVVMLPIGVVMLPTGVVMLPIGVVMLPIGVVNRPFYKGEAVLAGFRGQTGGFSRSTALFASRAPGSCRRKAVVPVPAPLPSATGLRPQLHTPA